MNSSPSRLRLPPLVLDLVKISTGSGLSLASAVQRVASVGEDECLGDSPGPLCTLKMATLPDLANMSDPALI